MKIAYPGLAAVLLVLTACSLSVAPVPGSSTSPTASPSSSLTMSPSPQVSSSPVVSTGTGSTSACGSKASQMAYYKLDGNAEAFANPALKGAILDSSQTAILDSSQTAILDSSKSSILDSSVVATTDRHGRANSAMNFKGQGYILIPVNLNPEAHPKLTMTAWARFTGKELAESTVLQVLSHDDGDLDRSMGIDYRANTAGWSAFGGEGGFLGAEPVVPGQWVHLAAVYDQAANTSVFYVNRQRFQTQGKLGAGHKTARIGSNPGFGEYFTGDIDEVRIYGVALTDKEIFEIRDCF